MEEPEAVDWKSRQSSYENIVQLLVNPTTVLLAQLNQQLPQFLSDINPNCQRTALVICDLFFKNATDINYGPISIALIEKCLGARQQNSDAAIPLVLQCMKNDRKYVTDLLFNKIHNKPPRHLLAVLSVIISHLASLTYRDKEEALNLIEKLQTLSSIKDPKIQKEVQDAIASAKIVIGVDLDSHDPSGVQSPSKQDANPSPQKELFEGENSWPVLICAENWKDRKDGYELLLSLIQEGFPLNQYENKFLSACNEEKHASCNEVAIQCIEKFATVFKSQLLRRLREYITPILNMMREKRQSRFTGLQSAFDAVALNVVSNSPFEPPFQEYILKMMSSPTIRLREEACLFISRCSYTPTGAVQEALIKLIEDPSLNVRDAASKAVSKISHQNPSEINISVSQINKVKQRARSPDIRKSTKRKNVNQSAINVWSSWVNEEVLSMLESSSWGDVTRGIEQLRKQFDEDPSVPHAVVAGLATIFTGKTFTPKVMTNIMAAIHFYISSDTSKMTDDALNAVLNFSLEKITDKRFENPLFDLLDDVATCNSAQYVFNFFYQHLSAKNPVIPMRAATYFAHYLTSGEISGIDIQGFAEQMKPLFTHGDQGVRKAAQDCLSAISRFGGEDAMEHFKYVRPQQLPNSKQSSFSREYEQNPVDLDKVVELKEPPADSVDESSAAPEKKSKSRVSEIPIPKRAVSPKRSSRPQSSPDPKSARNSEREKEKSPERERSIIPLRVLSLITKPSTILDCKKGLEEVENILAKTSDKKGSDCLTYLEVSDLFVRLRQWFKDSNMQVILSICKIIQTIFKLLNHNEFQNIPIDFLSDMILLLNYQKKEIKLTTRQNMSAVFAEIPSFIVDVFLPTFTKLNVEGKTSSIRFLRDCNFEMTVPEFGAFIVECVANKSDTFCELSRPIIIRYIQLPGAFEEIERQVESFPPAKKNNILSIIQNYQKKEHINSNQNPPEEGDSDNLALCERYFRQAPSEESQREREATVDPFLPLKILNSDEEPESLGDLLTSLASVYFDEAILQTDLSIKSIVSTCRFFLEIARNDFSDFSLVLDIIFMWCVGQALIIRQQDGLVEIFQFLEDVLEILFEHGRLLSEYEISLILPTVLECVGREPQSLGKTQDYIFRVCDDDQLLSVLVDILGIASSIFALPATFRALMSLIPSVDAHQHYDRLRSSTEKIIELVSSNDEENQRLLSDIAIEFLKMLDQLQYEFQNRRPLRDRRSGESQGRISPNKYDDYDTDKSTDDQRDYERQGSDRHSTDRILPSPRISTKASAIPQPHHKHVNRERDLPRTSICQLNDAVVNFSRDTKFLIYQWISDLSINDSHTDIQALKNISAYLKKDENMFRSHLDALIVSLLILVHNNFSQPNPPMRLCKYILFCLLTLISETSLSQYIPKEFIQQLIYEILTHLSNGINEAVINHVFNAIIVKLIDDRPMYAFMGLLAAVGEYETDGEFSEKWFRLAIKCFEACGARICEIGNHNDICNTFSLIDQFFDMHSLHTIGSNFIGAKVLNAIQSYATIVMSKFSDMIRSKESMKKLGENSTILALVENSMSGRSTNMSIHQK